MGNFDLILFGYTISAIDILIELFTLISSIYCFWLWYKLQHDEKMLDSKLILPADKELKKCKNKKAFKGYIRPRLLILGIVLLLSSFAYLPGIISIQEKLIPAYFYWLIMLPALVALVFYSLSQKKASKKFW